MSTWTLELWRLILVVFLSLLGGVALGIPSWGLAIGLLLYVVWQGRKAYQLDRWLGGERHRPAPEGQDIWGELFAHYDRLRRKNRRRKRRLVVILKEFLDSAAAMPDATVVLRRDLSIVWFNKAAQNLLGLRTPVDIGQRIVNLVRHPDFQTYLNIGEYHDPVLIYSPNKPGIILSLQLVGYGEQQLLLLARDVTRLQQLEQVRRDFVANASHELRTPLTVIRGYVETMREDPELSASIWNKPLVSIYQQAERMSDLIEDLLLLSRLEQTGNKAPLEPIAVPELIRRVCGELSAGTDGRVQVTMDIDDLLNLLGGEKDIHSVFVNLLSNALKYTTEGSVHLSWRREDDGAVFSVTDTGMGIAPENIPRLTERFYRADKGRSRDQGGTGLGLAIVKHGLERHGAELRIESKLGQGSTFSCYFPSQRIAAVTDASKLVSTSIAS